VLTATIWLIGLLASLVPPLLSLILLPALYLCSGALFNFLHKITECTVDLEKPLPLVPPIESLFAPNPANKLMVCVIFLLTVNQQLDHGIHIIAYIIIALLAPISMLIIAIESRFIQIFNPKLYFNAIRVLGKSYLVLMIAMATVIYCLYYFAWHQASFLNVIFSVYLLVVYHRYIGLILRNQHDFIDLPQHWIINSQAKSLLIENDEVRKCQRLIQSFQRYEDDPTLTDNLKIHAKRTEYKDGENMFLALQQLPSTVHAKQYSLHFAKHLMQTKQVSMIRKLLQWNANQNYDFFLETTEDNVQLLVLLISTKYFGLARYILESCCRQGDRLNLAQLREYEEQILDAKPIQ
jgi:hypothetical protein